MNTTDIVEKLRSIRHDCIEHGVSVGEAWKLSWELWNDDIIESIIESEEIDG
jgi:hypothetical protein